MSMAKLQKADFHIEITDQMKEDTRRLSLQLRQDEAVRQLFMKNGLPEELIRRKPWTIDAWRKEYAPCLGCKGLSQCGQKMKGYYPDLKYDGVLQSILTPCRYMRSVHLAEKHLENYRINDLPAHLRTISFASIRPESESQEYLAVVAKLIDASNHDQGVYLYGTMGSGKTYLAACAANDHARHDKTTAFVHYPSFVQRLSASITDGEYKKELKRAMYCDFLVLDDIGAESVTEWNRDSILLPLLNHRYENNLTTWFTSNCDFGSLLVHYSFARNKEDQLKSRRIMERIEHMSLPQALTGEDRRKNV